MHAAYNQAVSTQAVLYCIAQHANSAAANKCGLTMYTMQETAAAAKADKPAAKRRPKGKAPVKVGSA